MSQDYKELFEDYKEMLKRYCYAEAQLVIRKDAEGSWQFDGNLKDVLYIMGGHFVEDYVADEILGGDFPYDNVDKEGLWNFEFLLRHYRGDWGEPSYMEILVVNATYLISIEEHEKGGDLLADFDFGF